MTDKKIIKFSLPTRRVVANELIAETNKLVIDILELRAKSSEGEDAENAKKQHEKLVNKAGKLIQPMVQLPETEVEFDLLEDPVKSVFDAVARIQDESRDSWLLWRDDPESFPTGHQWVEQYFWALESLIPWCNVLEENEKWSDVFSGPLDLRAQYLDDMIGVIVLYFRQKRFFEVLRLGE